MQIHKRIKDHGRYDRSLKRQVARRYLAGEFSYRVAAEEYGLRDGSVVKQFVRWYKKEAAYLDAVEETNKRTEEEKDDLVESSSGSLAELHRRLEQAERERDEARLAAEGWRTMIDIAEQTFSIEIVKKSAAKPSAK
ncbi:hypothetical protein FUA23_11250 [Neolewinella aurantiaca]|uniref:Transposase n=1 Tax=Neolewinella aurantiaca TaxID=2602767 RepID=A0A5C7FE29_9BACT|nr:hypothetical protein [Neolewinella aurantiaca]TXF89314.1 hypothetical protein FUA23_11250 [Neolewinella aurantiaca]